MAFSVKRSNMAYFHHLLRRSDSSIVDLSGYVTPQQVDGRITER